MNRYKVVVSNKHTAEIVEETILQSKNFAIVARQYAYRWNKIPVNIYITKIKEECIQKKLL